jgi:hypothetical protein
MNQIIGGETFPNSKIWEESESSDEDDLIDDTPIQPIDEDFVNQVSNIKRCIYNVIVLSKDPDTDEGQDDRLRQVYQIKVHRVYALCEKAMNDELTDPKNVEELKKIPNEARGMVKDIMIWIAEFCKKNTPRDIIPYSDYLEQKLKIYPFDQRKSFYVE